jgi:hypothetical protein
MEVAFLPLSMPASPLQMNGVAYQKAFYCAKDMLRTPKRPKDTLLSEAISPSLSSSLRSPRATTGGRWGNQSARIRSGCRKY